MEDYTSEEEFDQQPQESGIDWLELDHCLMDKIYEIFDHFKYSDYRLKWVSFSDILFDVKPLKKIKLKDPEGPLSLSDQIMKEINYFFHKYQDDISNDEQFNNQYLEDLKEYYGKLDQTIIYQRICNKICHWMPNQEV